jgi:hypothetical protein
MATAFHLVRPSNSGILPGSGTEEADASAFHTVGAMQGWVDFSDLGPQFWIVVGAMTQGSMSSPHLRVRIGGTYGFVVDGDVALDQVVAGGVGTFAVLAVRQLVANIWKGRQLVKLTGQNCGGNGLACLSMAFIPA